MFYFRIFHVMRIITYNVNGIRAAISKGLVDWLKSVDADVFCVQETKAQPGQIPLEPFEELGYHSYIHSAVKKGYSGVAIFSKHEPLHVEYGMGMEKYDLEGRVLRLDFPDFSVISVYHPSGSSGDLRQAFKMQWLDDFQRYISKLQQNIPNLVVSGDYNICHRPIDIHDPVRNAISSGFLPEERAWMDELFGKAGYIDAFRELEQEPDQYTWWSNRGQAWAKNVGWRIDYQVVSKAFKGKVLNTAIYKDERFSDHAPLTIDYDYELK
jgi:exodeoxyribonuclease-3